MLDNKIKNQTGQIPNHNNDTLGRETFDYEASLY